MRLPIGFWPPNARAASVSLMILTFCPPRRSPASNPRPFTIGMRSVAKKSDVTMRIWLLISFFKSNSPASSGSRPLLPPPGPIAAYDVTAACVTPCSAATSSARRRNVSPARAGSPYDVCGSATRALRTPCGSNPGLTRCSASALRISRPAPTSSSSDSATSATISPARRRSRNPPRVDPRPPSRRPVCTSLRARRSAGARPQTTLDASAIPIANASAIGSMRA